ncbi:MAG: hypothetical protein RL275_3800 [Chloroflexota bacterium]|jgi:short-subunit dehydrogenase
MMDFKQQYGEWAVVAGASEGLGACYAEQLAERGLHLVLVARNADRLDALKNKLIQKYGVQVKTLTLDLLHISAAERIIEETKGFEVGLLIFNAASSRVGAFHQHSIDEHLLEIEINVRVPLVLIHHFSKAMLNRKRGGILLMSSLSAFQGSAYISTYAAGKAFQILLAEGLWEEWRSQNVDALVCVAGAIRTPTYIASKPRRERSMLEPANVARDALVALGKQPYVIPGFGNKMASFFMRHLLPRTWTIRLMGRILRDMYA